jgi:hypothetical protein
MKPKLADLTSTEVILVTDSAPGLPDGLFSKQKITIWVNFGVP